VQVTTNKRGRHRKGRQPCEHCGKPINSRKQQHFCSVACYRASQPHPQITICESCGKQFKPRSGGRSKGKYCSVACVYKSRKYNRRKTVFPYSKVFFLTCVVCKKLFTASARSSKRLCCSDACKAERLRPYIKQQHERLTMERDALRKPTTCVGCGVIFSKRRQNKYCSVRCANQAHGRESNRRRRAWKLGASSVEKVTQKDVVEAHGSSCHICDLPVEVGVWRRGHPLAFTLDHLLPLAHSGPHTLTNLRVAHQICNSIKSDFAITLQMRIRCNTLVAELISSSKKSRHPLKG